MQNMLLKIILIVAIIGLCTWGLVTNEIRLGKDLRGGTSLIYRVNIPDAPGTDREAVIQQTITVLKDRINPEGILDITFRPLGLDRIEVVMPLPNARVREYQAAYQSALDELLRDSVILPDELELALKDGTAVERYCGTDTVSDRYRRVAGLQDAYEALRTTNEALEQGEADRVTPEALAVLEQAAADAEDDYETRYDQILEMSLERGRFVRTLSLPRIGEPVKDANDMVVIDEETGELQRRPSARQVALDAIRLEFGHVSDQIDATVEAFDTYQKNRSGLDDPEDLIRLMRGAGVLEFHIAVNPGAPAAGANLGELTQQLLDGGPEAVDQSIAGWYPINDLDQWYDGPDQLAALEADHKSFFAGRQLAAERYEGQIYLLLYNLPTKAMTHRDSDWTIERTFRSVDSMGRPAVAFGLDTLGGSAMARLTGAHVGEPMAIVLDGQVFSAPTLQSQINRDGIITGRFSAAEIDYLIKVLAAGALEATLDPNPIAINTLGPTIGADNLRRGLEGFFIAITAVAIFMLLYYFFAGFVADIALLANGLIIFGVMAMIDGTFTLPGLAGIVLTIGMAVDANVLVYERIREEIFDGEEDIRTAVRLGYAKALSTIIDANVTNLIVCFVLFKTATAEVKGFALTLSLGILATLFTALFVTRVIYALYTDVFKARKLAMLPTVVPAIHRALEPSINWIGLRKIFWTFSSVAVVTALLMVFSRGVDMFDTEFRGGVTATMVTASVDADGDGVPDRENGEVVRIWLPQEEVEARIKGLAEGSGATAGDADMALTDAVRAELANASVLTAGATRTEGGQTLAQSFQIKVANPKGISEEAAITDIVVDLIVAEFSSRGSIEIDTSPARSFDGVGAGNAAPYVTVIEEDDLGRVLGDPALSGTRAREFLGGVAITINNLEPPATTQEITDRIEQMRNQPDFRSQAGRRTRIIGRDAAGADSPAGSYRSAVVLVTEPNLSALRVDSDVWFQQLAQPEWTLVSSSLQRRSTLQQVSSFSSSVAETLSANAIVAVVLSLLGILVYIWVRFGSLRYSVAAIIALVHDVSIALGLLAMTALVGATGFGAALGLSEFRIDLGVVAALLTIIGYSLNDTIVILDRIRENRGKRLLPTAAIINRSINQTVSRTVLTSFTTLAAVAIMYFEGGSGIRPFAFTLLVGLMVGTYSSIAIAAPVVFTGSAGGGETTEEGALAGQQEESGAEMATA